ncbi:methylmalonyl-CoA mutase subunit beta [Kordia algicida OT-1]|uniref:Putative methylmalonyl-CoA mutase small subunit n=1 Tax=Kordia algicida OT-1 TaxID=391587 RepID=A9E900_9FLAO|nr:methylmalonyl-CoA mutase subunit beta [Kordia algicida]EDP94839.1 putative methylmalonyl-CoA mutase small subunit [Kordia algicida OT-1]
MSNSLFNEFDPVSAAQWKQKIQVDLKGADYNETLITATQEGIDIKPFYHSENFGITQPIATHSTAWKVSQRIVVTNANEANSNIKDILARGAESIILYITDETIAIAEILAEIDLKNVPIHIEMSFLSVSYCADIDAFAKAAPASITLGVDIIGNLASTGNWFDNLTKDHEAVERILELQNLKSSLTVHVDTYQNAGANMVQQLAYALAHANEYLNHYGSKISNKITFNVTVGTHYFFEIAKLKALRQLWSILAKEYELQQECIIIASPSKRNKTLYDYNVNMLRTTTECMSAVLGGADIVYNLPYDALYHHANEFGDRIARNQLRILKDESYFDKTDNPTEGSYYIESITQQLAEKALTLFKDMEANGGFLKQLKAETIYRKIKESAAKEQALFDEGKEVLLGTNKYPNPEDRMKHDLEIEPFAQKEVRKVLVIPITLRRLATKLEKERLKNE